MYNIDIVSAASVTIFCVLQLAASYILDFLCSTIYSNFFT